MEAKKKADSPTHWHINSLREWSHADPVLTKVVWTRFNYLGFALFVFSKFYTCIYMHILNREDLPPFGVTWHRFREIFYLQEKKMRFTFTWKIKVTKP